jgi:hypothetical protein
MQAVQKAEQAGALSGEMLGRSLRKTLGFPVLGGREAFRNEEMRGEWEKGDDFPIGRANGKPGESKSSREQVVPTRIKTSGAKRGTASQVGTNR